jgi:hypothetical protein
MLKVAILGASNKEERYSNKAQSRLMAAGHRTYPVSKDGKAILGVEGYASVTDIKEEIDTATIYLRPELLDEVFDDLLSAKPQRVIFNPGTESKSHQEKLSAGRLPVFMAGLLTPRSTSRFFLRSNNANAGPRFMLLQFVHTNRKISG